MVSVEVWLVGWVYISEVYVWDIVGYANALLHIIGRNSILG